MKKQLSDYIRILLKKHEHNWKVVGEEVEGATLSWGSSLTRQFGWHYKCECGATKYEGGRIIPNDREHNPNVYDMSGWPLDEAGERLPLAE